MLFQGRTVRGAKATVFRTIQDLPVMPFPPPTALEADEERQKGYQEKLLQTQEELQEQLKAWSRVRFLRYFIGETGEPPRFVARGGRLGCGSVIGHV